MYHSYGEDQAARVKALKCSFCEKPAKGFTTTYDDADHPAFASVNVFHGHKRLTICGEEDAGPDTRVHPEEAVRNI